MKSPAAALLAMTSLLLASCTHETKTPARTKTEAQADPEKVAVRRKDKAIRRKERAKRRKKGHR